MLIIFVVIWKQTWSSASPIPPTATIPVIYPWVAAAVTPKMHHHFFSQIQLTFEVSFMLTFTFIIGRHDEGSNPTSKPVPTKNDNCVGKDSPSSPGGHRVDSTKSELHLPPRCGHRIPVVYHGNGHHKNCWNLRTKSWFAFNFNCGSKINFISKLEIN